MNNNDANRSSIHKNLNHDLLKLTEQETHLNIEFVPPPSGGVGTKTATLSIICAKVVYTNQYNC